MRFLWHAAAMGMGEIVRLRDVGPYVNYGTVAIMFACTTDGTPKFGKP